MVQRLVRLSNRPLARSYQLFTIRVGYELPGRLVQDSRIETIDFVNVGPTEADKKVIHLRPADDLVDGDERHACT